MPKFKLPAPKETKDKQSDSRAEPMGYDNMEWRRRVSIPVNQAILDALAVEGNVTVVLKGKVSELRSNVSEKRKDRSIEISIVEVEAYQDDHEDQEEYEKEFKD